MALVQRRRRRRAGPRARRSAAVAEREARRRTGCWSGRLQRIFIKPWVFSISAFPILWVSSLIGANPDVYLWEKIRSLDPLPDAVHRALPQRAGGARARRARAARRVDRPHAGVTRGDEPGARRAARDHGARRCRPTAPTSTTSTASTAPQRDELVVRCVRRGIDIETLHVDVCSDLDLFAGARTEPPGAPGARRAADAMQIPVYSTLTDEQAARVARVVRCVLAERVAASARRIGRGSLTSVLVYLPIFLFAILEGEIYYSTVCARAMAGELRWLPVLVAGALGGAAGDQLWFYLLRGRIHWLDRYPRLAQVPRRRQRARPCARERHGARRAASCPGCAPRSRSRAPTPAMRPLKFSALNLVSAFAWAGAIMLFVKGGSRHAARRSASTRGGDRSSRRSWW